MTVGNRAVGAPINIWNDWGDSMSARDGGWIQLFVESNQQAVDVHIQAFKLAEKLSLPVMVCMDGFILTHSYSRVDIPDQEQVRSVSTALCSTPGARSGRTGIHGSYGWSGGVY